MLIDITAQTQEVYERALADVRALAVALFKRHYADNETWKPFDDLCGLISQIDNMTAGLVRPSTDAARCAALEEAIRRALFDLNTPGHLGGAKTNLIARNLRTALAQEQPSPTDATPAGYVLVPREPTEAWVHAYASQRQGQKDPPRCEPPSDWDLNWCRDRISEVLAAISTDATRPSDAGEVA